jgi:hypothetical protein
VTYSYFGVLVGKAKATLALLSAVIATGHAAVWLGASSPDATRWTQAGIADVGSQRFAYVETNSPAGHSLVTLPAPARAAVRVFSRGGRYRVTIAGHASRWVWVPHASLIACLELYGDSHAVASINGRVVRH